MVSKKDVEDGILFGWRVYLKWLSRNWYWVVGGERRWWKELLRCLKPQDSIDVL